MTSQRQMLKVEQRVVDVENSGMGNFQSSTSLKLNDEQDSDEEEALHPLMIAKQVVASARARIKKDTAASKVQERPERGVSSLLPPIQGQVENNAATDNSNKQMRIQVE